MLQKRKVIIVLLAISFLSLQVSSAQIAPGFYFSYSLSEGMSNADVKVLQEFLKSQPSSSWPVSQAATGFFGNITKRALSNFQSAVGISPAVGYFGPITRKYVNSILSGQIQAPSRNEVSPRPNQNASSSIKITSPSVQSEWQAGKTYTIAWATENFPVIANNHMFVSLSGENNANWSILTNGKNSGSLSWTIPDTIPSGTYQIIAYSYVSEAIYLPTGTSDPFRIIGKNNVATPSITIQFPTGGETLEKGKTYEIKWATNNFPSFEEVNKVTGQKEKITPGINSVSYLQTQDLAFNGVTGALISPYLDNAIRSIKWTIPNQFIISGNYVVKIECLPPLKIYGCKDAISKPFTILDPGVNAPLLTLTTQGADITLAPGSTYKINWSARNVPVGNMVSAYLLNSNLSSVWLGSYNAELDEASVVIPEKTPPGTYFLRISAQVNGKLLLDGSSWIITVPLTTSNQPIPLSELKITSPNSNTVWKYGSQEFIIWNRHLEEINYSKYQMCDAAYYAVVNANTDSVVGYIDYINTAFPAGNPGGVWRPVGTVLTGSSPCGGVGSATISPGKYKIRLSFINPETDSRVNVDSETFTLTQ